MDKCEVVNLANCNTYINKNECFQCEDNFYLSAGRCFAVDVIDNCSKNKDKDHCELCETGYALASSSLTRRTFLH